jgi:hypothetical protein
MGLSTPNGRRHGATLSESVPGFRLGENIQFDII